MAAAARGAQTPAQEAGQKQSQRRDPDDHTQKAGRQPTHRCGVVVWNVADDPLSETVALVARAMRNAGFIAKAIQVSPDEYSNTVLVAVRGPTLAREDSGEAR